MELDPVTFNPTYRIMMDAAGSSAGLEIAERLGLSPEIVGRARELLDPEARRNDAYLRQLMAFLDEAESTAKTNREELEQDRLRRERVQANEAREAAARGIAAHSALDGAVKQFRLQARNELAGIRDSRERGRMERLSSKAERRLRSELVRQRSDLEWTAR